MLVVTALAAFSIAYAKQPRRRSAGDFTPQSNSSDFALGDPSFDWTSTTSASTSQSQLIIREQRTPSHTLRLKRNKKDTLWVGPVPIGTLRFDHDHIQTLDILFSTSSSRSWVGSCAGFHNLYIPTNSPSSEMLGPFYVDSVDMKATGRLRAQTFTDFVDVANIKSKMEFGVIEHAERLEADAYDGIFSLSRFKYLTSAFRPQNFLSAGNLPNVFAFNMPENGAEIRFGWSNVPGIVYYPTKKTRYSWPIDVTGKITVGESVLPGDVNANIDSGTPMIHGPLFQVSSIYKHLGIKSNPDSKGYYRFPCDHEFTANVHFTWGNRPWTVLHKDFIYSRENEICTGIFRADKSDHRWKLGQRFNKDKFIEFDDVEHRIGLAMAVALRVEN